MNENNKCINCGGIITVNDLECRWCGSLDSIKLSADQKRQIKAKHSYDRAKCKANKAKAQLKKEHPTLYKLRKVIQAFQTGPVCVIFAIFNMVWPMLLSMKYLGPEYWLIGFVFTITMPITLALGPGYVLQKSTNIMSRFGEFLSFSDDREKRFFYEFISSENDGCN